MSTDMKVTGLGEAGQELWEAVTEEYDLRADEYPVLVEACRTKDELEAMNDAIQLLPSMVTKGAQGQERTHPIITEARAHRLALRSLMSFLGLEEDPNSPEARSAHGRRLARARWGNGKS